jgi:outer membrane protein assembly factor BamD
MGMNDLRDDADRVMKKTFPTSRFYKDGLKRKTAWWHLW